MSHPAFETHGLTVYLEGRRDMRKILSNVELTVRQGRTFALLGESGSGKTCLIHSVLGVHQGQPGVVSGSAKVLGQEIFGELDRYVEYRKHPEVLIKKDLAGWRRAQARAWGDMLGKDVTLIPQDASTSLSPFHTIGQMLSVVLERANPGIESEESRGLALSWLSRVEMYDVETVSECYIHELSGGMAQRAAIALALAPGPRLLIADEPTTGLDATLRISIISLLHSMVEEKGATLLLVTHDLAAARILASDVAILYEGTIVETGSVDEVLDWDHEPKHPYTSFLLESEKKLIEGASPRLAVKEPAPLVGCPYSPRCEAATSRCLLECPTLREFSPGHNIACFVDDL
ncbi:ABC transporter ATP-binding protein [bacterium]|nr:MAG: ABC transporter ATP-binding protein [bacterium]